MLAPPDRASHPLRDGGRRRWPASTCARSTARAGSSTPRPCTRACVLPSRHVPRSRLLWVEQTSNLGGGSVWPLERIARVVEAGRHHSSRRTWTAPADDAVVAERRVRPRVRRAFRLGVDRLHEGLGAPVGAALAGSRDFIAEAWRCKQQMGRAPCARRVIIAAGGATRLRTTSRRWPRVRPRPVPGLVEGLAALPRIKLDPAEIDTNLVFFDVTRSSTPRPPSTVCSPRRPPSARWAHAPFAPSRISTWTAGHRPRARGRAPEIFRWSGVCD